MAEIIFVFGVIVALIVGFVLSRIFTKSNGDNGILLKENEELKRVVEERNTRIERQNLEITRLVAERAAEHTMVESLTAQLAETKSAGAEELQRTREEAQRALEQRLAELREVYEQKLRDIKAHSDEALAQQLQLIKEQMQTTSERVLKSRQEELESRNEESVSRIVDPLRESIKRMSEALDSSKREHHDRMQSLDTLIRENLRQSHDLGATADRLAQALTTKVKTQGNFGELHLKKFLEDMGLMEGTAYTTQQGLKDKYGKKIKSDEDKGLIPDFILHFPNKRDVIVDSKVVITDFERYMSATTPEEKAVHLKAHIEALRAQVDGLSKKDYSKYLDTGYTKLDFVIMYVFHEGALNLALMNDTSLWRYAYDKHVLIMGPQTMYMNLRVLELMWTQSRQLTNQDEIMKQAKMIIERVKLFARRLTETETSMQEVLSKFKELRTVTAEKGKSIITPANELIRLSGIALKSNGKGGVSPTYIEGDETSFFGEEKKKKKNSTITDEDATVIDEFDEDEGEDVETLEADTSESSEQNE